jgi:prepilin-type N-terminal cleavage/methylation domain-containing protein
MTKLFTAGFSLFELVLVIVLLGIVVVIAVPRYIDLTSTSRQTSVNNVAAALAAASAENYAKRSANTAQGSAVNNCTAIGSLLPQGLPANYAITSQAITAGNTVTCTVTGPNSTSATFSGIGIN